LTPPSQPQPQIFNEDKGYDNRQLVFLSPLAPALAVRRVLLTHPHSAKILYLQGSPFRQLVSRVVEEEGSAGLLVGSFFWRDH